jgi:hypothetical protein
LLHSTLSILILVKVFVFAVFHNARFWFGKVVKIDAAPDIPTEQVNDEKKQT